MLLQIFNYSEFWNQQSEIKILGNWFLSRGTESKLILCLSESDGHPLHYFANGSKTPVSVSIITFMTFLFVSVLLFLFLSGH